ncbi:hypothetical protein FOL46_009762 [Perkinsus olseni]|uniref:Farnesyl pyrophosphate synthetase n=2 Tax=Perkinsus olseni TaxID=32597 RepID=A0A7J6KZQ1_PEROL|nr:hypothetical protein FOL46_009762 [Perkinsus olseni]
MSNPPTTTTHHHTSKHNTLNTASSIEVNDNTTTTSKFRPPMIRDVMRNIIKERIDSAVVKYPHYDPDVYAAISDAISNDIKDRIADLNIPRYKILVQVIIAEYNGQGIRISSKCLWDNNMDNLATDTYITDGGKLNRGTSLVAAFDILHDNNNEDDDDGDDRDVALKLAWCVEILQSHFLTLDDVMDSSTTRRGKPCWYRRSDVGVSNAINDGVFLYSTIFPLIKRIASKKGWLMDVMEVFANIEQCTLIGQNLDVNGGGAALQEKKNNKGEEKEIER